MNGNIENIIQELIKIEDAAGEITALMEDDRKRLSVMLEKKALELEVEMAQKTENAVRDIKEKASAETDDRLAEIASSTQRLAEKLRAEYESSSRGHIEEIFNNVIGRV